MTQVKKMRRINDYTQEFVANKLGVTQTIYSQKENGKVKFSVVEALKLAELYDTSVEELFKDVNR